MLTLFPNLYRGCSGLSVIVLGFNDKNVSDKACCAQNQLVQVALELVLPVPVFPWGTLYRYQTYIVPSVYACLFGIYPKTPIEAVVLLDIIVLFDKTLNIWSSKSMEFC